MIFTLTQVERTHLLVSQTGGESQRVASINKARDSLWFLTIPNPLSSLVSILEHPLEIPFHFIPRYTGCSKLRASCFIVLRGDAQHPEAWLCGRKSSPARVTYVALFIPLSLHFQGPGSGINMKQGLPRSVLRCLIIFKELGYFCWHPN